jgi:hypothetical protein
MLSSSLLLLVNLAPVAMQGLGSESHHPRTQAQGSNFQQKSTNENTSIYVAGLSPDLTDKDLGKHESSLLENTNITH